jgi:hypothetical protein
VIPFGRWLLNCRVNTAGRTINNKPKTINDYSFIYFAVPIAIRRIPITITTMGHLSERFSSNIFLKTR